MKLMHFSITIRAPKETVWDTMLQLQTYRSWTAEFMPGSYYEGSWEHGAQIRFLGPGGSGISSVIAESKPYQFISIKHLGMVMNGSDDMESPAAKAWSSAYENYTIADRDGSTELKVELSGLPAEFEQDMAAAWPKALAKLKSLCE